MKCNSFTNTNVSCKLLIGSEKKNPLAIADKGENQNLYSLIKFGIVNPFRSGPEYTNLHQLLQIFE